MENKFLILPGCDDRNRGDQALIWETVSIAKDANYNGTYYMLSNQQCSQQSQSRGIECVNFILKHPSRLSKKKENIKYDTFLKISWGCTALMDLFTKELLLHKFTRKLFLPFFCKEVRQSLNMFMETRACFVKGGGFLHAYNGLADTYKVYYFLYHIRLAQSLGKKVFVMPNSFGPFNAPLVKKMMHKCLSKCEVVMAREKKSQEELYRECGIRSELFIDIAFHLPVDKNYDSKFELENMGVPIGKKICVGITMRPYRFTGYQNADNLYINYQNSLAKFILWLDSQGIFPVLIEHVYDDSAHEKDMSCINDVEKLLNNRCEYAVFSNRKLTCLQLKKIYSEFDYMVGTRFHSVIFSLSSYVPSIAITYGGNKGKGIMEDLNLDEYYIPMESITFDLLKEKFEKMRKNNDAIKRKLLQEIPKICEQRSTIVNLIKET